MPTISKKQINFGVEHSSFTWLQFSADDDAVISENWIATAGGNLPMHSINTLTTDHRRGLQQLTSQRTQSGPAGFIEAIIIKEKVFLFFMETDDGKCFHED